MSGNSNWFWCLLKIKLTRVYFSMSFYARLTCIANIYIITCTSHRSTSVVIMYYCTWFSCFAFMKMIMQMKVTNAGQRFWIAWAKKLSIVNFAVWLLLLWVRKIVIIFKYKVSFPAGMFCTFRGMFTARPNFQWLA